MQRGVGPYMMAGSVIKADPKFRLRDISTQPKTQNPFGELLAGRLTVTGEWLCFHHMREKPTAPSFSFLGGKFQPDRRRVEVEASDTRHSEAEDQDTTIICEFDHISHVEEYEARLNKLNTETMLMFQRPECPPSTVKNTDHIFGILKVAVVEREKRGMISLDLARSSGLVLMPTGANENEVIRVGVADISRQAGLSDKWEEVILEIV
jgi:hypothetical protein